MQVTGMLYGAQLLKHVDFPTSEVLGPDADEDEIKALIDRHKMIFIKPLFKGGIGKKGNAGLIGRQRILRRPCERGSASILSSTGTEIQWPRQTA
jgi:hypothetical protein